MELKKITETALEIKRKYWDNPILDHWRRICALHSTRTAIIDPRGNDIRTFHEIDEAASEIAHRIRAVVPPGSVVSLQGDNSAAWIEALLGTWMAECVVLLEDKTLSGLARDAAAQACGSRLRVKTNGTHGVTLDPIPDTETQITTPLPAPNAVLVKLTSGTTGTPRGVLFSANQLLADCNNVCDCMGIATSDRNFGVIAFSHSYGFSNLVTPLICRGIPLVAADDALPRAILDGVTRSHATVLPAVPALFESLAAIDGSMPSLRLCISAGAPLRCAVADAFHDQYKLKLHSFYGASECGGICFDSSDDRISVDGFVGTPMPGISLIPRKQNDDRMLMMLRSESVALATIPSQNDPDFNRSNFPLGDWLEGNLMDGYRIVGRESDWINIAGRKLDPAEIEGVLRSAPTVTDAVVFGVDDPRRGQSVCALVAANLGTSKTEILRHCEPHLSRWQIPREIHIVPKIPVNARGKVNRREIAAQWQLRGHMKSEITKLR